MAQPKIQGAPWRMIERAELGRIRCLHHGERAHIQAVLSDGGVEPFEC